MVVWTGGGEWRRQAENRTLWQQAKTTHVACSLPVSINIYWKSSKQKEKEKWKRKIIFHLSNNFKCSATTIHISLKSGSVCVRRKEGRREGRETNSSSCYSLSCLSSPSCVSWKSLCTWWRRRKEEVGRSVCDSLPHVRRRRRRKCYSNGSWWEKKKKKEEEGMTWGRLVKKSVDWWRRAGGCPTGSNDC